jgi:hypothetical protein
LVYKFDGQGTWIWEIGESCVWDFLFPLWGPKGRETLSSYGRLWIICFMHGAGTRTQGLLQARQAMYHRATFPAPELLFNSGSFPLFGTQVFGPWWRLGLALICNDGWWLQAAVLPLPPLGVQRAGSRLEGRSQREDSGQHLR